MLFPDYHFHTDFSSDCDEPIQAVIASAKEKDLSALCVTDHYDMDFPVRPEEPDMDFDLVGIRSGFLLSHLPRSF